MPRKEFVRLIEENVTILDHLGDRLKKEPTADTDYPRHQMHVLVRLYNCGPAMLKDIARREQITTPNLCATFRKLEAAGLVKRTIDDNDRRNTWYDVTDAGRELAQNAVEKFRDAIEIVFGNIAPADEVALTSALKTMNSILSKMEKENA